MSTWSNFVRQATFVCLVLAVALAVVLLTVTHQVRNLEEELGGLRKNIAAEQQKMHVLQAEFSFLIEPERLRRLANAHLGLVPVEPAQLGTFTHLDQALLHPADRSQDRSSGDVRAAGGRERHR